MDTRQVNIGFLLSGGGRSLENLHEVLESCSIEARINLVISSKKSAGGLDRARRLEIPYQVHRCREPGASERIFEELDAAGCHYALLGGWLRKLQVPERWLGRVLNIHPSLLPKHGGKGCYGDHVHRAVLEGAESVTGCTVHFVDDEYDHGAVILQEQVPVLAEDTVESLAGRVFEAEKKAYPRALKMVLSGEATFSAH